MDNNFSLSDIAALTKDNDGMFGGNGLIILILFFLFFGMNGWGGKADTATASQVYDATQQQNINNGLAGIKEAVNAGTYETSRQIDNLNVNGLQNTNTVTSALNAGFFNIQTEMNNLSHQLSDCCCNLRSQMLQDKYDDVRNQLNLAEMASANAVQTQNILGSIGRFVTNPPCYGQYNFGGYLPGTTIS